MPTQKDPQNKGAGEVGNNDRPPDYNILVVLGILFVAEGSFAFLCDIISGFLVQHSHPLLSDWCVYLSVPVLIGSIAAVAYKYTRRTKTVATLCVIATIAIEVFLVVFSKPAQTPALLIRGESITGAQIASTEPSPLLFTATAESATEPPPPGQWTAFSFVQESLQVDRRRYPISGLIDVSLANKSDPPFMISKYEIETRLPDGSWSPTASLPIERGFLYDAPTPAVWHWYRQQYPQTKNDPWLQIKFDVAESSFNQKCRDVFIVKDGAITGWIYFVTLKGWWTNTLKMKVWDTGGRHGEALIGFPEVNVSYQPRGFQWPCLGVENIDSITKMLPIDGPDGPNFTPLPEEIAERLGIDRAVFTIPSEPIASFVIGEKEFPLSPDQVGYMAPTDISGIFRVGMYDGEAFITTFLTDGVGFARINNNRVEVCSPGWMLGQDNSHIEVVNERRQPVLQMIRNDQKWTVYGMFKTSETGFSFASPKGSLDKNLPLEDAPAALAQFTRIFDYPVRSATEPH